MPLFCSGVNEANDKKLVPITRKNGGYIVPEKRGMVRESFKPGADKRLLWVLAQSRDYKNNVSEALICWPVTSMSPLSLSKR